MSLYHRARTPPEVPSDVPLSSVFDGVVVEGTVESGVVDGVVFCSGVVVEGTDVSGAVFEGTEVSGVVVPGVVSVGEVGTVLGVVWVVPEGSVGTTTSPDGLGVVVGELGLVVSGVIWLGV